MRRPPSTRKSRAPDPGAKPPLPRRCLAGSLRRSNAVPGRPRTNRRQRHPPIGVDIEAQRRDRERAGPERPGPWACPALEQLERKGVEIGFRRPAGQRVGEGEHADQRRASSRDGEIKGRGGDGRGGERPGGEAGEKAIGREDSSALRSGPGRDPGEERPLPGGGVGAGNRRRPKPNGRRRTSSQFIAGRTRQGPRRPRRARYVTDKSNRMAGPRAPLHDAKPPAIRAETVARNRVFRIFFRRQKWT